MKQIFILLISFSLLFSCASDNESNESVEVLDEIDNEQVETAFEQTKAVETTFENYFSSPYISFANSNNPVTLSEKEFKLVCDFFKKNKKEGLKYEVGNLVNEVKKSKEDYKNSMPLFVDDFYQSPRNTLLFIRSFNGAGSGLSVLSIANNEIVSKIFGITLDADSDGLYFLSSKYEISNSGLITVYVTEEEGFLNETGINDYVIEYQENRTYTYRISVNDVGIFSMDEETEIAGFKYANIETLESWNKSDLRKLRNYLFARHSYIFKSKDLSEYFSQFDWYHPEYSNVDDKLSKTDKKFISLVKEIEDRK